LRPGTINLGTKEARLCQFKADFLSVFPCCFTGNHPEVMGGSRLTDLAKGGRDYGFLQRVFWESIDSTAVPTTGIVLSILAGSLQSSSVR